jgi:hypothetical protein
MVGMAVEVAHDVEPFLASGALNGDMVFVANHVTDSGTLFLPIGDRRDPDDLHGAIYDGAHQHSADLMRVAGAGVSGDRLDVGTMDLHGGVFLLR